MAEVHLRHQAPATFFIVAQLAVAAGSRLREILDHELFDLESHSYTHDNMIAIRDDAAAVRRELVDSKRAIEDLFGREVIGFTAPGGFAPRLPGRDAAAGGAMGGGLPLRPHPELAAEPRGAAAPLTQPFWFSDDGFPELLEISAHAWHDNILTGQPSPMAWPPALPWGLPVADRHHRPRGVRGLRCRHRVRPRPGAADVRPLLPPLVDLPASTAAPARSSCCCSTPRRAGLTPASCNDVHRHLVAEPQLASPAPKFPTAASA